jgi:hypothetical protein
MGHFYAYLFFGGDSGYSGDKLVTYVPSYRYKQDLVTISFSPLVTRRQNIKLVTTLSPPFWLVPTLVTTCFLAGGAA